MSGPTCSLVYAEHCGPGCARDHGGHLVRLCEGPAAWRFRATTPESSPGANDGGTLNQYSCHAHRAKLWEEFSARYDDLTVTPYPEET